MFAKAVAALFKPGEFAASLFAAENNATTAQIINLHDIQHPEHLPSYWTLSIPGWYDPDMGNLDLREFWEDGKPKAWWRNLTQDVYPFKEPAEVFIKHPPFLVFEVDYLLAGGKSEITPETKKLQREAMAYAFQASGFPFSVLVDSGGKSIHAYVRLEDDLATIAQFREGPDFQQLQDLAWVVFGHYDQGVMKQAGRARLVRTPGALREDGSPQTILAVGQRTTINGLRQWFFSQLSPEAQAEVVARQPVTVGDSPLRQRYLRIAKWRSDLMKPHVRGERGTHWMFVSKSLATAGCMAPKMVSRPSPSAPFGHWQASWLWHVSAYVFNYFSKGWFFSHSSDDWTDTAERSRWWGTSERNTILSEQVKFEGAGDPLKNSLVAQFQENLSSLPPVMPVGPDVHVGGTTGATLQVDPNAPPPQVGEQEKKPKKSKEAKDYEHQVNTFFKCIPLGNIKKLSSQHGDQWRLFDPRKGIWTNIAPEQIKSWIQHGVYKVGVESKHITEVFKAVENHCQVLMDTEWVEYEHAVAFANGTLYVEDGKVDFQTVHNPADQLCSRIPFNYNPQASCPQWERFMQWALPDSSRRSLLQEAFGYTLVAGQPFQSFFLFTGIGSNGKSVVLSILRQIHQESYETVPLASLGDRFGLGTLANKRLAIDTEAESAAAGRNGADMALAQNTLKAWTGGDAVKAEAKRVQGWSTKVNAKYFLSANRRPKFMDPTKGVWRRMKLLKFEATVEEKDQIPNLDKILAAEMSGIINWAVTGLLRLYAQNGFTTSPVLTADIHEYQNDTDSAFQFFNMFLRDDPAAGWHDIRPVYQAYKAYCVETGCFAVNEAEFRQRLTMKGVKIGQPEEHEPVWGAPVGQTRIPGKQYWSIRGFRCLHPTYATAQVVGLHPKAPTVPQIMAGSAA